MALDTFANLKQAVERMSKRDDLVDILPDLIVLCEKRIDSVLQARENNAATTSAMTIGSRYLSLPTRFSEMRRVNIITSQIYEVTFYAPEQMTILATSGLPNFFTVTSQLEFDRPADQAYNVEMSYWTKLNPLSDANPINNILTNYPELYLYGTLGEVFRFARDEDTASYYDGIFDRKMGEAQRKEKRARYGPAPRMRIEGQVV